MWRTANRRRYGGWVWAARLEREKKLAEAAARQKESLAKLRRQAEERKPRVYVVKSGDSLSKIAKEVLGDASRWPEIFEANKDQIQDPNRVSAGQVLALPALPGEMDVPPR